MEIDIKGLVFVFNFYRCISKYLIQNTEQAPLPRTEAAILDAEIHWVNCQEQRGDCVLRYGVSRPVQI